MFIVTRERDRSTAVDIRHSKVIEGRTVSLHIAHLGSLKHERTPGQVTVFWEGVEAKLATVPISPELSQKLKEEIEVKLGVERPDKKMVK